MFGTTKFEPHTAAESAPKRPIKSKLRQAENKFPLDLNVHSSQLLSFFVGFDGVRSLMVSTLIQKLLALSYIITLSAYIIASRKSPRCIWLVLADYDSTAISDFNLWQKSHENIDMKNATDSLNIFGTE